MLISWLYLAGALVGLWFTWQALRPVALPSLLAIPSFFAGWLTNELVFHHYAWQAVVSVGFVAAGALDAWPGWVALAVTLLQWALMAGIVRDALATPRAVEDGVVGALGEDYRDRLPPDPVEDWDRPRWGPVVAPFWMRHRRVRSEHDIRFGRVAAHDLRLDVFRPVDGDGADGGRRPVLVYVHGGAWVLGFRDRQGVPLLTEMAARGWIGVRPAYRLSPLATFPDHLVDVKRAIAWVREHADELGADPDFIAISGGSAGGHLAALAALTSGRADLQPGFESADTSVQAAVPLYGVYDPTNHLGHHLDDMGEFFARVVIKADPDEDPARWALASPLEQLHPQAPPFLVVHGEQDSLTSPQEARGFVSKLQENSRRPVGFVALPGAQHAFDTFPSLRTAHTVRGVARFLGVLARDRDRAGVGPPEQEYTP